MIIYVTRHGQPAIGKLPPGGNHQFPPGDPGLTDLGIKQAKFLGAYFKQQNFKGKIISSPYIRTLQTANEIALATDLPLYVEKYMQEYVHESGRPDISVLSLEEIKEMFPVIADDARLPFPWLLSGPEDEEIVYNRVKPFMDNLRKSGEKEVILTGHGATVHACKRLLFEAVGIPYQDRHNWNCSVSKFVVDDEYSRVDLNCDVSFIPDEFITSNLAIYPNTEV